MAAPEFQRETSSQGYEVGELVWFQPQLKPSAPPQPAGTYTVSNLPPGLSFSATTGLITGTPTTPCVCDVLIYFSNTNGGCGLQVCFGVCESGFLAEEGIEVDVDVATGEVTFPTASDNALHAKSGDKRPFLVALKKKGRALDLPVSALSFGVKEFEDEKLIVLSEVGVTKVGVLSQTRYRILVHFDPAKLKMPLSNWQARGVVKPPLSDGSSKLPATLKVTQLLAPSEFSISILQPNGGGVDGTAPIVHTFHSQTFAAILQGKINK